MKESELNQARQTKALSRRVFLGGTAAFGGAAALSGLVACSP